MPDQMLTAKQVAELLAITPMQVYLLGQAGKLPRHVFGPRCVRFSAADVQAYIAAAREGASLDKLMEEIPY